MSTMLQKQAKEDDIKKERKQMEAVDVHPYNSR